MPQNILGECGISLWNFSLEVHTGRIFQNILGIFYILLVPLSGMAGIVVVISGYLLWRKKYKTKNHQIKYWRFFCEINLFLRLCQNLIENFGIVLGEIGQDFYRAADLWQTIIWMFSSQTDFRRMAVKLFPEINSIKSCFKKSR